MSNDMQPVGACFGVALRWELIVFSSFNLLEVFYYLILFIKFVRSMTLFFSLPSIVVQHRPVNKNVPNKNITLAFGSNLIR